MDEKKFYEMLNSELEEDLASMKKQYFEELFDEAIKNITDDFGYSVLNDQKLEPNFIEDFKNCMKNKTEAQIRLIADYPSDYNTVYESIKIQVEEEHKRILQKINSCNSKKSSKLK